MAEIRVGNKNELSIVQRIAMATYHPAYLSILEKEQLDYMLGKFYSLESLEEQREQGHVFLIARIQDKDVGFASYNLKDSKNQVFHLQKIYFLPEIQGKGLGRQMIDEVVSRVKNDGGRFLRLNVNRFNDKAKAFYEKLGFTKKKTVDIPIGGGYYMNDYVMELNVQT